MAGPDTLQAHPCALGGGHPWPPTVRTGHPRHYALASGARFWLRKQVCWSCSRFRCWHCWSTLVKIALRILILAPQVRVRWRWRPSRSVDGHGWPSPSLHGRTCGVSGKAA